jgi:two-component system, response regulator YesN
LLKLIIVDDEKVTREGIRDYIPWSELGVEVVGVADDGINALELAMSSKPDIILCDVRMPRMNGIELATQLKDKLPECKVIFLSAHSDKEYLKSAIQLKVLNYVEKPVNLDEVISVIREAVITCTEEKKKREMEINIKMKLKESSILVYEKVVLDLASSHLNKEVLNNIHSTGIDFPVEGHYITAIFKIHWKSETQEEVTLLRNKIIEEVKVVFRDKPFSTIQCFKDNEHLILHINEKRVGLQSRLKTLFEECKECINEIIKGRGMVFIGVGKRVNSLLNLFESYQTVVLILQKQFFSGYNKVVFYDYRPTTVYIFDETLKNQFIDALRGDKKEIAITQIKQIVADIKNHENTLVDQVKNIFFNLVLGLSRVAEERNIWITDRNDEEKYLWDVISNANTLNEIEEYIIDKIEFMYDFINQKEGKGNTVYTILKYVKENYFNEDLSIKSIADYTFLTSTYLCLIFKNGTGKTINQFITEVRMEKAKELLKDRKIKLYEVASKVGYPDANYFAKAFKKMVGLNPSEYRERYLL